MHIFFDDETPSVKLTESDLETIKHALAIQAGDCRKLARDSDVAVARMFAESAESYQRVLTLIEGK